eukprot:2902200-Amphidinium_carterae.1
MSPSRGHLLTAGAIAFLSWSLRVVLTSLCQKLGAADISSDVPTVYATRALEDETVVALGWHCRAGESV